MGQFGEDLRKERETRGIAIGTITNVTKISGRHLLALEQEHFDALPGGVFNKGIVRGYARVVGLDEDTWVGRFMSAYQQSGQLKDDDVSWIEFAENVSKGRDDDTPRPDVRLRWAGVAVLLVLLSALGWFVWHFVSNRVTAENVSVQHSVSAQEIHTTTVPITASAGSGN
ncbi:helix-turn-helix domain-containing protein [Alloacidobacterium dinghuense]|uniref:Helix-turn-helix domain-containing protein n=1 Tax=Alloacidobacterium dinghuense TaxID=2763107 RepID=A0A7G8BI99_9BACT|nr:helix-turn-helix domain-containing protein [Alloacidobacterium dinghuense]QNI32269.1 helix-turn-helix domain-containing protein [Alloacidobacterium dinghuense]